MASGNTLSVVGCVSLRLDGFPALDQRRTNEEPSSDMDCPRGVFGIAPSADTSEGACLPSTTQPAHFPVVDIYCNSRNLGAFADSWR